MPILFPDTRNSPPALEPKFISERKPAPRFAHVAVQDGIEVRFGQAAFTVLETPGHTLESICLVVTDAENAPKPCAVLTGDTLFIGDVGRPDLSPDHTPQQLAGLLYDSLHEKAAEACRTTSRCIPPTAPVRCADATCGAERSSTIGTERLTNYALQIRPATSSCSS